MKRFLVIESFLTDHDYDASVAKFQEFGYLLSDDIKLLNSWKGVDSSKRAAFDCITLIEAPSVDTVDEWMTNWSDFSQVRVIELH